MKSRLQYLVDHQAPLGLWYRLSKARTLNIKLRNYSELSIYLKKGKHNFKKFKPFI